MPFVLPYRCHQFSAGNDFGQDEPFTSNEPETVFNMSKFLLHCLATDVPNGISKVYLLFFLSKFSAFYNNDKCKKTSQFKKVFNGDTAYITQLKQQKSKRCSQSVNFFLTLGVIGTLCTRWRSRVRISERTKWRATLSSVSTRCEFHPRCRKPSTSAASPFAPNRFTTKR